MYKKIKNIHMVGIGGAGMSGIAEILLSCGYNVTGSDLKKTEITERLKKLGAKIFYGHKKENISSADIIVISTAINKDNPEIKEANKKNIPVIARIEMLAELARLKYTIGVAGTHGKTTTTSMVGLVLQAGGLDPTVVIGGKLVNFGSGIRFGKGKFFVAEADESDGSFLKLSPTISIVTNIDDDHLDYYKNMENLRSAFVEYLNKVPFYGCCIICIDDPQIRLIRHLINRRCYTYGLENSGMLRAEDIQLKKDKSEFRVRYKDKLLGKIELNITGLQFVRNALAAISCGIEVEVPFSKIKKALSEFKGVSRRLELKGVINGVYFIDDYGHHPTEISATIETLRKVYKGRIFVFFQPHRFSRTKILLEKFGYPFRNVDYVFVSEIYSAGEKALSGINSELIIREIRKYCKNAELYDSGNLNILKQLKPEDVVLTLGAGDIWKLNKILMEKWKSISDKVR